mmetsp:Transcript_21201/g.42080  ORF Transcript_21201/g.42080 Transcript_21201/m.42080 type:complete len:195 (+) Transcript_21201:33-617(+)
MRNSFHFLFYSILLLTFDESVADIPTIAMSRKDPSMFHISPKTDPAATSSTPTHSRANTPAPSTSSTVPTTSPSLSTSSAPTTASFSPTATSTTTPTPAPTNHFSPNPTSGPPTSSHSAGGDPGISKQIEHLPAIIGGTCGGAICLVVMVVLLCRRHRQHKLHARLLAIDQWEFEPEESVYSRRFGNGMMYNVQ